MPLPSTVELAQALTAPGADSTSAPPALPSVIRLKHVEIFHELGRDLRAEPVERTVDIPPSSLPSRLVIRSEVKTDGARKLRSAAYMAVVRRREAKTLATEFANLGQRADREDFAVVTFPATERLKKLLSALADAEQEGNTREILRRVRDSIQNGGWERYRKPEVRAAVASILGQLAELEEVLPGHVASAEAKLAAVELDSLGHLFDSIDDHEPSQPGD